jgi:hypothetical protein
LITGASSTRREPARRASAFRLPKKKRIIMRLCGDAAMVDDVVRLLKNKKRL